MARLARCALLLLASCGGFKPIGGDAGEGDLAATSGDQGPPADLIAASDGGSGPGPAGALPSGYCCTAHDECRHRHCLVIGGAKRCADLCRSDEECRGGGASFRCLPLLDGVPAHCEPPPPLGACRPATEFRYGMKKLGACCTATHDGTAGLECEGGLCISFNDLGNPYICTRPCARPLDCPGNFSCAPTGNGYSICLALADKYTCQ